jgi:CxxC-x17-CxxC domain-containing protein
MNDFRFNDRSRGGRDGRGSSRPPLHDAVCNECGKDCKVPFRPSGSKPVFCSECFEQKGGGGDSRDNRGGRSNQRDSFRPRFGDRDSGRPPRREGSGSPDLSRLTRGIDSLNSKMDRIISLLESSAGIKPKKAKGKKMDEVAEMVASLKKSDADLAAVEKKKAPKSKAKPKKTSKSKAKTKKIKK